MDAQIKNEINNIMAQLESDAPGATEGLATLIGAAGGSAVALTALSSLGTVAGLSAAGITSGLAAAGAGVSALTAGAVSAMAAGIGVIAAPIFLLGGTGYMIANHNKKAKMLAALNDAIEKLYNIQNRLKANAEHHKVELESLSLLVDELQKRKKQVE